jgi:hypothetical protein
MPWGSANRIDAAPRTRPGPSVAQISEKAPRLVARQHALADAAARLRRGAAQLERQLARDATFYAELGQLQRFWKVKGSAFDLQCHSGWSRIALRRSVADPVLHEQS